MGQRKPVIFDSLLAVAAISLLLTVTLSFYYMDCMPRVPQPESGRIHALHLRGGVVYLTWFEKLLYYLSSCACFVSTPSLLAYGLCFPRSQDKLDMKDTKKPPVRKGVRTIYLDKARSFC
jgi:hypothetical protein